MIKVETDSYVTECDALEMAKTLIKLNEDQGVRKWNFGLYEAKITQISKAGNIFIHVSKAEERKAA